MTHFTTDKSLNEFKKLFTKLNENERFDLAYHTNKRNLNNRMTILDSNYNVFGILFYGRYYVINKVCTKLGLDTYDIIYELITYIYSSDYALRQRDPSYTMSINLNVVLNFIYNIQDIDHNESTLCKYLNSLYNTITNRNVDYDEFTNMMTSVITPIDGTSIIGIDTDTVESILTTETLSKLPISESKSLENVDFGYAKFLMIPRLCKFYNTRLDKEINETITVKFTLLILTELYSLDINKLWEIQSNKTFHILNPLSFKILEYEDDEYRIKLGGMTRRNSVGGNFVKTNNICCIDLVEGYNEKGKDRYYLNYTLSLEELVTLISIAY